MKSSTKQATHTGIPRLIGENVRPAYRRRGFHLTSQRQIINRWNRHD